MGVSHLKQRQIWNSEHIKPHTLVQMDSDKPSGGVVKFIEWAKRNNHFGELSAGVEMACGKGRNVIWLASQGFNTTGFDFSEAAIAEAKERTRKAGLRNKTRFLVLDATQNWTFTGSSFDFVIDCFATTDIESVKGRKFAADEIYRVLKQKGFFLVYSLSTDDEFHKEMVKKSPAREKNAFINPISGKFEKTFDRKELLDLYGKFELLVEDRVKKVEKFFGKSYKCKHHWMVFQKL